MKYRDLVPYCLSPFVGAVLTFSLIVLMTTMTAGQISQFAGTWTGSWTSGFGTGSMSVDVTVAGNDVTGEVTLGGVIFAVSPPHAPFTMEGVFDPATGITLTDPDNPIYGPLTITIGLDGSATAEAPNVPSGLINSATGSGQLNLTAKTASGNGTPDPDFGGDAKSTFNLELTSPAATTSTFYLPQVGEGVSGAISFNTLLVLENTSTEGAAVTVDFYATPNGTPMEIPIVGLGTSSSFNLNLDRGETVFLQTPGNSTTLKVGYARVTAPDGVSGTGIFTRQDNGVAMTKAGVPASSPTSNFSTPIDTRGSNNIGLALVNPPASGATAQAVANLTLRLYDTDFNLLGTQTVNLAEGAHMARFVNESDFFAHVSGVNEMTGSMTVESSTPVAVTVLLQDDAPASFPEDVPILTAFPVLTGRADSSNAAEISFEASQRAFVEVTIRAPESRRDVEVALIQLYRNGHPLSRFWRKVPAAGQVRAELPLPGGVSPSEITASIGYVYSDGGRSAEAVLEVSPIDPK